MTDPEHIGAIVERVVKKMEWPPKALIKRWCETCDFFALFERECTADVPCRPPERNRSEAIQNVSQPSLWTPRIPGTGKP
jgi:hypothetical protein